MCIGMPVPSLTGLVCANATVAITITPCFQHFRDSVQSLSSVFCGARDEAEQLRAMVPGAADGYACRRQTVMPWPLLLPPALTFAAAIASHKILALVRAQSQANWGGR